MTSSIQNKKNISLKSFIEKINSFKRKISHDVLLIEFDKNFLNIANAYFKNNKINIAKVRQIELPEKAIEKSIPSDPILMAEFIRDVIQEEKISTCRISIIISMDAIYTRLINVPSEYSFEDSYQYVSNPNSGLQIPIPVQNIDFDLLDINTFAEDKTFKKYLLLAMPKKSMNTILEMTKNIGCKVCNLEATNFSQLRLISSQISKLEDGNFILLVDLTPECTFLVCVSNYGPFLFERLASIRNFTKGKRSYKNSKDNIGRENESSLPISKLDLKVLFKEITGSIKNIVLKKSFENFSIFLTGHNSQHANIRETFEEHFKTKVEKINAFNSSLLGNVNYNSSEISEATISKLIGHSLGLFDSEDFLQKTVETKVLDNNEEKNSNLVIDNVPIKATDNLQIFENKNKDKIVPNKLEIEESKDLISLKKEEINNTDEIIQNVLKTSKELDIDKLFTDNEKPSNSKNSSQVNLVKGDIKDIKNDSELISSLKPNKKSKENSLKENKEENLFKGLNISEEKGISKFENEKNNVDNSNNINEISENKKSSKKSSKKSKNEFKIDPDLIDLN